MSAPQITISFADLHKALSRWESDSREGKCTPRDETDKLPAEEVVTASAEYLWDLLTPKVPATT